MHSSDNIQWVCTIFQDTDKKFHVCIADSVLIMTYMKVSLNIIAVLVSRICCGVNYEISIISITWLCWQTALPMTSISKTLISCLLVLIHSSPIITSYCLLIIWACLADLSEIYWPSIQQAIVRTESSACPNKFRRCPFGLLCGSFCSGSSLNCLLYLSIWLCQMWVNLYFSWAALGEIKVWHGMSTAISHVASSTLREPKGFGLN